MALVELIFLLVLVWLYLKVRGVERRVRELRDKVEKLRQDTERELKEIRREAKREKKVWEGGGW